MLFEGKWHFFRNVWKLLRLILHRDKFFATNSELNETIFKQFSFVKTTSTNLQWYTDTMTMWLQTIGKNKQQFALQTVPMDNDTLLTLMQRRFIRKYHLQYQYQYLQICSYKHRRVFSYLFHVDHNTKQCVSHRSLSKRQHSVGNFSSFIRRRKAIPSANKDFIENRGASLMSL